MNELTTALTRSGCSCRRRVADCARRVDPQALSRVVMHNLSAAVRLSSR
jgi:hypothetical protein